MFDCNFKYFIQDNFIFFELSRGYTTDESKLLGMSKYAICSVQDTEVLMNDTPIKMTSKYCTWLLCIGQPISNAHRPHYLCTDCE